MHTELLDEEQGKIDMCPHARPIGPPYSSPDASQTRVWKTVPDTFWL
jgi:hypothetical protein